MNVLTLFVQHKYEDIALALRTASLAHQFTDILSSIFWFTAVPERDDVGDQGLLDGGTAETTASEMIGTGSGVACEKVTPGCDVCDPDKNNGSLFLSCPLTSLGK